MRTMHSFAVLVLVIGFSSLSVAQQQFVGQWQTKVSPATGKHLFTLNIEVKEGKIGGSIVLVDPVDGREIKSGILNAELSGETLEFESKVGNDTFNWRLTLKSHKKGLLHGSMREMVIDEPVVKQS